MDWVFELTLLQDLTLNSNNFAATSLGNVLELSGLSKLALPMFTHIVLASNA